MNVFLVTAIAWSLMGLPRFDIDATPAPAVPDWCPVTLPNGEGPIDPNLVGSETGVYGNDGLSTYVQVDGTYPIDNDDLEADGGWNKRGWWRDPPEPITVSMHFIGERVTSAEPKIHTGSGYEITRFQATATWFPEPGCWSITASTPTRSLTIVTWVIFMDDVIYGTPVPTPRS